MACLANLISLFTNIACLVTLGEGYKIWYRGSYSCIEITVTSDDLSFTIDPVVSERKTFLMSEQTEQSIFL